MDPVGEVERRGAAREGEDLPLGREDVDLVRVEVDLQRGEERARVLDLLLPLQELAQPEDVGIAGQRRGLPLLVAPVRRDPLLGDEVHLAGADLDLERLPLVADHGGVERLVEVGLGHRDVVLEPARDGAPVLVDDAERGVGVLEARRDDAEGEVVVELGDVDPLPAELLEDRVVALDAEADLGVDPRRVEAADQTVADALGGALPHLHLLGDLVVQLGEVMGVEMEEGEVLEVPLDPRHAEAVGDRRVDLQGLARDAAPRLGLQVLQGLHVVQAVGELDDDDADVLGRGQDHLAEGLGLGLVAPHVLVAADLGDAVDELGDLGAELLLQRLAGGEGVLQHVVEQPDGHAGLVELEVGEQPGDVQRVDHVRLAGAADLVLVHLGGEVVDGAQELRIVDAPLLREAVEDLLEPGDSRLRDGRRKALRERHERPPRRRRPERGTSAGY